MAEKDAPAHLWFMERRFFPLIIALVFITLSAVTFFLSYRHHTINTEQTLKEDRSSANLLSLVLEEHLKKIVSVMESYTQRPFLLRAVRDKNVEKTRMHLINLKKNNPDVDILIITDRRGTLWAAYPERPESVGVNFAHRDWYKGVSKEWKSNISDAVLRVVEEKDLAVQISVPFVDETGKVIGILTNTQRTVGLNYLFKTAPLDSGTTITIADRQGRIVYDSRHDVETEIKPYPFHSDVKKAMAAKNNTFAADDPDSGGRRRYISFSPVANIGWTVFVERDQRSVLLSESAYYIQLTAIAFLLFLSIIFFLAYSRKQVIAQKIQEQLKAEIALRQSEESALEESAAQLRAVLDATPFPIALVDTQDNTIDFWSHSALTLFGHTAPTTPEWYQLAYPDPDYQREVIERWKPFLNKARESRQPVNTGEYRITCRDGSVRICELYATFLTDILIVTFSDITERKRAEVALLESEKKFRAMAETIPLAIYLTVGIEQKCEYLNPTFIKLFGYTLDIIPTVEQWWPLAYPDETYRRQISEEWTRTVERAIETQTPIEPMEVVVTCKDGSKKNILWGYVTIGEKNYAYGLDLTERKQAEAEACRLNAELEQRVMDRTAQLSAANKELEAFSYSVSHDLRAPLRSIDGFSQALLEEYQEKLDDTGKTYLVRVRKAIQRMGLLIDDMLNLSRISQAEMKHEAVDLSAIIRAIAEEHQKNNPDRAVDVIIQKGIMVQGDPYLMKIAVENLVDNAWKFTSNTVHPRIEFGTTVRDGETACFIRDNGAGFDMAYVDKLFGAFQRLHTKEEFAGTGIGLATVQRIIHRHGGRIRAEGEVGKGATFYFTLPS